MGLFNKFKKESKKEESTDIPVPKKIIELSDIKKEKEIKESNDMVFENKKFFSIAI